MSERDVITFDHVWFHRGAQPVLEDLTLHVPERCFVGIIGPNGGGKTTVIKLILGLLKPTRGDVRVFGERVERVGQWGGVIGYVPQRADVDWSFPTRVIDVVTMGAYGQLGLLKRVTSSLREQARQRLEWLGIEDLARKPIGNLSGGQQRRAFIARALMGEPRLLLLDEPAAGLDTATHQQLLRQLRELQRRLALTVVMVSHDIGELASASDRIACLNQSLHWHDASDLLSDEVLQSVYACELQAYRAHHHEICHEHREA